MKRTITKTIYDDLRQHNPGDGSFVAVLFGLRGVGKTYVLQEFSELLTERYIRIDLVVDRELCKMLSEAVSEVNASDAIDRSVIKSLATYFGMSEEDAEKMTFLLDGAESLGDHLAEILCRRLPRVCIFATNRWNVCNQFSIMSDDRMSAIKQNVRVFHVRPMSFEEFLGGIGSPELYDTVRYHHTNNQPIPDLISAEISDLYYDYMLVGGFPQAVEAYRNAKADVSALRYIHGQIYAGIVAELSSSAEESTDVSEVRLRQVLRYFADEQADKERSFTPGRIARGLTGRDFDTVFHMLVRYGVLMPVYAFEGTDACDPEPDKAITYAYTDTGLQRYLRNDYDVFYNMEREELPLSVLKHCLRCEVFRAGLPVMQWNGPRTARISLVLPMSNEVFAIRCEESKRSRSTDVFEKLYPGYTTVVISDAPIRKIDTEHNIMWFELAEALKSKKR
ncbi:MAG: ATP-binding protein [Lachnospiraceae bacterium]|nr:ATP-binding protein [Lachnospiraceae bacterium]